MARAASSVLGSRPGLGLIAGPAAGGSVGGFEWFAAAHPFPDDESERAARRALTFAARVRAEGGHLLVLLSGGASSLLALPAEGISLEDKRVVARRLMEAGTDIRALNAVRKHLSGIKGGRLAAVAGRTLTLAISDVHHPPDDPASIGSGPTVPDPSTYTDALRTVAVLGGRVPRSVREHLEQGAAGHREESPKPGNRMLADSQFAVIANRHTAERGAAADAARRGYDVVVLPEPTGGEAVTAGRAFAAAALRTADGRRRVCVIASGEPTVTVRGQGRGGRNQEFALGAAEVLADARSAALVASIGTDGVDGPTDAAGALVSAETAPRADARGSSIREALANNDAYPLFDALGDLIKWGPTLTNVGDVHVLIAGRR